jgi:O-succinylbenzoate synthase
MAPAAPERRGERGGVRIEAVELRLVHLRLVRPFETSFGRVDERRVVLVRADGDGATGWGECVADADPFYSAETTHTCWHVLETYLVPAVLGLRVAHPRELAGAMRRVRGHSMAKAALEMAAWDLAARQAGVPLAALLGGTREAIASGVSIGIQPSIGALVERVAAELEAGYQRVKIKIKPGWDVEPVRALRERFGTLPLMVDANAAYTLETADALAALDEAGLMMIEQPLDYDDLSDHAVLQARLETPICLDESIASVARAADAIALRACRIVNIKPGRVGGHAASIALHDLCAAHGVPVWHGGMLETGIGRAHNVHLAALPNFSLPGDIAASRRYFDPDIVEPPIDVRPDGTIPVPQKPGIGVEVVEDRLVRATEAVASLRA